VQTAVKEQIVPTIGSNVAGPLGVLHLPRLWTKLSLASRDLLPPEYDECGDGFDAMTLSVLGLSKDEVISYVRSEQPTYVAFELWVLQKNGGSIHRGQVQRHNQAILTYNHSDAAAAEMRANLGLLDNSIRDAVTLNMLDDFDEFHARLAGGFH
jgi:hypothetical protein